MSVADPIVTEADILAAVVALQKPAFNPEIAQSLLNLRFSDEQIARMRELADRNNQGTISPAEHMEMENYARVGNFLSLIQSKARLSLNARGETQ